MITNISSLVLVIMVIFTLVLKVGWSSPKNTFDLFAFLFLVLTSQYLTPLQSSSPYPSTFPFSTQLLLVMTFYVLHASVLVYNSASYPLLCFILHINLVIRCFSSLLEFSQYSTDIHEKMCIEYIDIIICMKFDRMNMVQGMNR